jgi:hypothetical protein
MRTTVNCVCVPFSESVQVTGWPFTAVSSAWLISGVIVIRAEAEPDGPVKLLLSCDCESAQPINANIDAPNIKTVSLIV